MNYLQKIYYPVLFFLISLSALIAPVGFNGLMPPDEIRRAYIEISVVFVVFYFLIIRVNEKSFILIRSPLSLPVVFIILWSAVSVLWALNKYEAFLALANWIPPVIIFFIVSNILLNEKQQFQLLFFILISGFLISCIGFLQHIFGLSLIPQVAPPAATFGNKNQAAQYMTLTFPLALYVFLFNNNKRILYLTSVFLPFILSFSIIASSRANWIAITAEIILFFYLIRKQNYKLLFNNKDRKIGAVIFFILFLFLINQKPSMYGDMQDRIGSVINQISLEEKSVNNRLLMWFNSWPLIKENILIGTGIGNWRIFYPKYANSVYFDRLMSEGWLHPHAHNDLLEIIASLGLVGFFLFCFLFYQLIKQFREMYTKDEASNYAAMVSLISIVGIIINSLFSFPLKLPLAPYIFMVFLGIISNSIFRKNAFDKLNDYPENIKYSIEKNLIATGDKKSYVQIDQKILFVFIIFTLIGAYFVINKNISWIKARLHYSKALVYNENKNGDLVVYETEKALKLNNFNDFQYNELVTGLIYKKEYEKALNILNNLRKTRPYNPMVIANTALCYNYLNNYKKSNEIIFELLSMIPNHNFSINILDDNIKKIMDSNYSLSFFQSLTEKEPRNTRVQERLGMLAEKMGRYDISEKAFRNQLSFEPESADAHANLAVILYYHMSKKDEAISHFKKAIEYNPNHKQAENIKKLIQGSVQ
ncbi:MAG: O-antigen ligase family protein [Spirochaetia bacterium]|nr:O-antigen ligase family protein [Spirochaetia bacterium]